MKRDYYFVDFKKDGIDHINIYSKGLTILGRYLSNFSHFPVITDYGKFESLEGYWYWLLSKKDKSCEILKKVYGFQAKQIGRDLECPDFPENENLEEFTIEFGKAMEQKIEQNPFLKTKLKESLLPFTHYYVFGGKIVYPKNCEWIIDKWEIIRENLKDHKGWG